MTAVSYTGVINTQGNFETIASLTGLTLTTGKTYTMQTSDNTYLKCADAIFNVSNKIFTWVQGTDAAY